MKNIVFLLLLISTMPVFGQTVKITPNGFFNTADDSKRYVVLDFPNISKEELFLDAIKFINANYERPEEITNILENEQIVITDFSFINVKTNFFNAYESLQLKYFYKYDLQFRDGKIRIEPKFDYLRYIGSHSNINLIGDKSFNSVNSGLFNRKGKAINKDIIEAVDEKTNEFIRSLEERIQTSIKNEW